MTTKNSGVPSPLKSEKGLNFYPSAIGETIQQSLEDQAEAATNMGVQSQKIFASQTYSSGPRDFLTDG